MDDAAVVDIEEHAKAGKTPPEAKSYRIKVDKESFTVHVSHMKGREILELVKKTPDRFKLFEHLHGGGTVKIDPEADVSFRKPGVERFKTLPIDPTDGLSKPKREFQFPESDHAFLERSGLKWEAFIEGTVKWLIIRGWSIPSGYKVGDKAGTVVDIALRIEAQYPMAQIDMAYFSPQLTRVDGKPIANLSALASLDGHEWQQWSRHRSGQNPWRPGVDDLETHLLLVEHFLQHELTR